MEGRRHWDVRGIVSSEVRLVCILLGKKKTGKKKEKLDAEIGN